MKLRTILLLTLVMGLCIGCGATETAPAPQEPEKLYSPYVLSNSPISLALQSAAKL